MTVLSPVENGTLPRVISRRPRSNVAEILRELELLHSALMDGDSFPSRRELVEQLGTSERAVREALDQLERDGKIIRRVGRGGSVVAKLPDEGIPVGHNSLNSGPDMVEERGEPGLQPVLAIGEPDGGVFDQAMRVLMKQAKSAKLDVHCRFMQPDELERFPIPALYYGPRRFVIFRWHFLSLAQRLQAAGHQVVFIGTPHTESEMNVPSVSGDQRQGGYAVIRHLVELGHRRIAFHFAGNYSELWRWAGSKLALDEATGSGLDVETEILDWNEVADWKQHPDRLRAYFGRSGAPTAIVSWNDEKAVELLTLLLFNGIRVPDDVSLMGYDNLPRSAEVHPALTTVDGALNTQIQCALRLLAQPKIPVSHQTLVTPTLVVRESTAAPP